MRQIHPSAWLLVALSAVLQTVIFPLPGVYILSWFAIAPLLIALLRARPAGELEVAGSVRLQPATPWQGFLLGYVCGIVWYGGTCYWIYDTMRQYGGLSAPMALLALFLFCCYLGLYHGVFGLVVSLLARPHDHRRALVLAPFLWVAIELARTRISGYPWALLGISQIDNVALCRIAGFTGVYGISFEIVLVNVAIAAAISSSGPNPLHLFSQTMRTSERSLPTWLVRPVPGSSSVRSGATQPIPTTKDLCSTLAL